jgi:hypothetical protein
MRYRGDREVWVERQAETLIRELGDDAYGETRRMMRAADDLSEIRSWNSVREVVARRICIGESSNSAATRLRAHLCETLDPRPNR